MRDSDHSLMPVGEGNVISNEFNRLYRWHATLSAQDTAYVAKMFEGLLNGQDPAKVYIYKLF
jgi:linoleate 10R-lipoxygenase